MARGGIVLLYMTGEGATNPTVLDGTVIGAVSTRPKLPVTVTIGGVPAVVQYAGGVSGLVAGVMQVNVQIPANAPSGDAVEVIVTVGDQRSRSGVTLSVE